MLRAHEVSPFGIFGFIENGSKRADLDAFLRLALFLHITNIADRRTNFSNQPICSVTKGTESASAQPTSASAPAWRDFIDFELTEPHPEDKWFLIVAYSPTLVRFEYFGHNAR